MPIWFVNPSKKRKKVAKRKTTKVVKSKSGKRLYGAAAKARAKALAKAKRKRKNPAKKRTVKKRVKRTVAKKVRRNPPKRRKTVAKRRVRRKKRVRRNPVSKRRAAARKAARTRAANKRKRSAAAKKAARTRKRRSNPSRKRRVTRRRRSNPSRKRRVTRKRRTLSGPKRTYKKTKRVTQPRYGRKAKKSGKRGVASLARARRTIKTQRKYGGAAARAYANRYKIRTNPAGGMLDALKQAAKVAVGFAGTKYIASKVQDRFAKEVAAAAPATEPSTVEGTTKYEGIGKYYGLFAATGTLLALNVATRKVGFLKKHREHLMIGSGLAVIVEGVKAAGIAGHLGLGEYITTGEYVTSGEYVTAGEYYGEMGEFYGEMGNEFYSDMAGTSDPGMLYPAKHRAALKPATHVDELVAASPFSEANLYAGIFGDSMF